MITIDKNVPTPTDKMPHASEWRRIVDRMDIGDSFEVPIPEGQSRTYTSKLMGGVIYQYGRFVSRRTENGIRFWLLEKRNDKT